MFEDATPDSELKLIDFGFACEVTPGHEKMWEKLGTPSYMAPELWDGARSAQARTHARKTARHALRVLCARACLLCRPDARVHACMRVVAHSACMPR